MEVGCEVYAINLTMYIVCCPSSLMVRLFVLDYLAKNLFSYCL